MFVLNLFQSILVWFFCIRLMFYIFDSNITLLNFLILVCQISLIMMMNPEFDIFKYLVSKFSNRCRYVQILNLLLKSNTAHG